MKQLCVLASCVLSFLFISSRSSAQNGTIYLLRVSSGGLNRQLTGFSMISPKGNHNGIVTALHGVASADFISATYVSTVDGKEKVIRNLKIEFVDISKDLAFLKTDNAQIKDVFTVGTNPSPGDKVHIPGHPLGIEKIDLEFAIMNPAYRPLEDLLPKDAKKNLLNRRSPEISENILSLQGDLGKGYSGAPVISKGKVIAVANGGLSQYSSVQVSWAIPINGTNWVKAESRPTSDALRRLKSQTNVLSTLQRDVPISVDYIDRIPYEIKEIQEKLYKWEDESYLSLTGKAELEKSIISIDKILQKFETNIKSNKNRRVTLDVTEEIRRARLLWMPSLEPIYRFGKANLLGRGDEPYFIVGMAGWDTTRIRIRSGRKDGETKLEAHIDRKSSSLPDDYLWPEFRRDNRWYDHALWEGFGDLYPGYRETAIEIKRDNGAVIYSGVYIPKFNP